MYFLCIPLVKELTLRIQFEATDLTVFPGPLFRLGGPHVFFVYSISKGVDLADSV